MTDTNKSFTQYMDSLSNLTKIDTLYASSNATVNDDSLTNFKDFDNMDWHKLDVVPDLPLPVTNTSETIFIHSAHLFDGINLHKSLLTPSMLEQIEALLDKKTTEETPLDTVKELPQSVMDIISQHSFLHPALDKDTFLVKTHPISDTTKILNLAELLHTNNATSLETLLDNPTLSKSIEHTINSVMATHEVKVDNLPYFDSTNTHELLKVCEMPAVI